MAFDGPNLAALRERRKLTGAQLAAKAGCSRMSVHRWEAGQRQPQVAEVLRLAAALGVKPERLLR